MQRYLAAIWRPAAPKQVLFKAVLVAREHFGAPICWRIWPQIPRPECVVLATNRPSQNRDTGTLLAWLYGGLQK